MRFPHSPLRNESAPLGPVDQDHPGLSHRPKGSRLTPGRDGHPKIVSCARGCRANPSNSGQGWRSCGKDAAWLAQPPICRYHRMSQLPLGRWIKIIRAYFTAQKGAEPRRHRCTGGCVGSAPARGELCPHSAARLGATTAAEGATNLRLWIVGGQNHGLWITFIGCHAASLLLLPMDEDQIRSGVAELSVADMSRAPGLNSGASVAAWGAVELDAELAEWLRCLPTRHLAAVAFYLDLLAAQGPQLRWPHVRQVDAKLRKLRFHLDGRAIRIIYWIAPGHRIVLLTVFMKSRMREQREIARARIALKRCQIGARATESSGKRRPE